MRLSLRAPSGARQSVSPILRHCEGAKRLRQSVFFQGEADSFALCTQNDKLFSHCTTVKDALRHRLVIASTVRCAAIRFSHSSSLRRSEATAAIRFSLFKRIKSSCARAARAPYFCTDRNREKNRRTPSHTGFRTFLFERTVYKRAFLIKLHIRSQQTAQGDSPCESPFV